MKHSHTVFVCVTCASSRPNHAPDGEAPETGGQRLLRHLSQIQQETQVQDDLQVQPARCMGVCDRDCAIAFTCPGKVTYLFGDLPSDDERLHTTAAAVLDCATRYYQKSDGALSYSDRPELLKTKMVARIPATIHG